MGFGISYFFAWSLVTGVDKKLWFRFFGIKNYKFWPKLSQIQTFMAWLTGFRFFCFVCKIIWNLLFLFSKMKKKRFSRKKSIHLLFFYSLYLENFEMSKFFLHFFGIRMTNWVYIAITRFKWGAEMQFFNLQSEPLIFSWK